jgi:hypothetical protein
MALEMALDATGSEDVLPRAFDEYAARNLSRNVLRAY